MTLTQRELQALTYVLGKLPDFLVAEGRRALLDGAGLENYIQRINLQGAARTVASDLVHQLKKNTQDLGLLLRSLLDSREDIPIKHVSLMASIIIHHSLVEDPDGYLTTLRMQYGQLEINDPANWTEPDFDRYQADFTLRTFVFIPILILMAVVTFTFMGKFPGKHLPFSTRDSAIQFFQGIESLLNLEKTFNDDIRIVAFITEKNPITALKKKELREHYASLIGKLSKAGTKIIAFDMYFKDSTDSDEKLVQAVKEAKARGTSVLIGANYSRAYANIEDQLGKAGSEQVNTCIGELNGTVRKAPLAVLRKTEVDKAQIGQRIPIADEYPMALKIFQLYKGMEQKDGYDQPWIQFSSEQGIGENLGFSDLLLHWTSPLGASKTLGFSELISSEENIECHFSKGDRVAYIILDFYPMLESRSASFFEANLLLIEKEELDLSKQFKDKIVLVGIQAKDCDAERCDMHAIGGENKLYGLQLQANVLNALLNNEIIQSANEVYQLIILICLSITGGAFRHFLPERKGLMSLFNGFYLLCAVTIYIRYRIVLDIFYPIGAFWLVYWMVPKLDAWLKK